jgi:AcrR family transcriptional regulator
MSATGRRARLREQRENTRRDILTAAAALLRERPYRELSVEAVMAQTGLTRTAFYRHFDDIPDLVLRLLAEVAEELQEVAERWSATAGAGFPAPALAGLAGTVDFFARHGPLLRAVAEAAATDAEIEVGQRRLRAGFVEMTAVTIERLAAAGQVDVPDARAMALALNLMNESYLLEEFGQPGAGDREVALATLEAVWLRVLRPPGGPATAPGP